ncbi:hypothetical protein [Salinimicrobium sp. GXAS 041]|uniref:hypothetical protein n=1 Tax=Salinimicrobium sp. GXAS 041 TaxID=3400806 RepID=UPI003C70C225
MIIDPSYFTGGKVYIPNAASNASVTGNVPNAAKKIESYIARYEEELLSNALGYENYTALKLAIEQDANLEDPVNEKWKDLVNGKAYSYEGKGVKWNGLRQVHGELKTSLIANYVFFHYMIDDVQNYTTTGVQKEKAKNATEQSPNRLLTLVWREFVEKYQFGANVNPTIVHTPSGPYTDYFRPQFNMNRSLYQFLQDNDNYGDFNFRVYENRNRFGI